MGQLVRTIFLAFQTPWPLVDNLLSFFSLFFFFFCSLFLFFRNIRRMFGQLFQPVFREASVPLHRLLRHCRLDCLYRRIFKHTQYRRELFGQFLSLSTALWSSFTVIIILHEFDAILKLLLKTSRIIFISIVIIITMVVPFIM